MNENDMTTYNTINIYTREKSRYLWYMVVCEEKKQFLGLSCIKIWCMKKQIFVIYECVENPIFLVYLVWIYVLKKKADIYDSWMCEKKKYFFRLSGI